MERSYWSVTLNKSRIRRRRMLGLAGGGLAAAAFLAACGGDDGGDSGEGDESSLVTKPVDNFKEAKRGGTIKSYHFSDVQGFDPGVANAPNETNRAFTYSWLTQYEPGYLKQIEYKPVPDIAESWEFSPDNLTVTMKIRKGVKFHNRKPINGRPLDVEDIVFSYNRMAELSASRTDLINAANPNAPFLSFTATDANTVVLKLARPVSTVLSIFAYGGGIMPIIPKETGSTFDIRTDQIGTGPYILESYQPSIAFKYRRNPDYWDNRIAWAETVEMPIIPEYAAQLSQLRAGNVYTLSGPGNPPQLRGEDALPLVQDTPGIQLFQSDMFSMQIHTAFGWLPEGKSPWLDERVRQAYSMSMDRDAWIDAVYNVSRFEAAGLPVQSGWSTCIATIFDGWLDPRDKEFGENAKYFEHNIAEAKKLLSAAGYPNGFEYISTFPAGNAYGPAFPTQLQAIEGFGREAGMTPKPNSIDYIGEFLPKYRVGKGQHDGVAYKIGPGYAWDGMLRLVYELHSKGGANFYGFSASGRNDLSGDSQLDGMIDRGLAETDLAKRREIIKDIQRYMGKKQYMMTWPGSASGFEAAWPALGGFGVYRGSTNAAPAAYWWVDETQAPIKRA